MRIFRWMAILILSIGLCILSCPTYSLAVTTATGQLGSTKGLKEGSPKVARPGEVRISPEYGRVTEVFDSGGDKLVIHIQDAHTNYEAQLNSAHILEDLITQRGLYLIFVEGGSRDVSLHKYRENATLEARKKQAEESLKEGIIAGEEYLNIATDYPMKLQGIEDRALYDQNMTAFLDVDKGKDAALALAGQMTAVIENLKPKVYSKQLKELDEKRIGFKETRVKLADYVKYLSDLARSKKMDMNPYPNYKRLLESTELEKTIDFNAVEKERADVIDVLSKNLGKDELDELMSKSVSFKEGKLTQTQYHVYLKNMMEKYKININKYPNLDKYVKYLVLYEKIDSAGLFKDLKGIEERIEEALFANDEQRRLAGIAGDAELLVEFINLKLGPDDFEYYQKNEGNFIIPAWIRFLNSEAIKYKLTQRIPEGSKAIETVIPSLKSFYTIARKRDDVFLNNTKKYMDLEKVNIAALIAGGFHTPSLTKLFKENNISYMVVMPKVVKPTDEKLYHKILTEGWAPAEQTKTE